MTVLIIDAPEVMQRSLAQTLNRHGLGYRLAPDERTDAVPDPTAEQDPDAAIWFTDDRDADLARSSESLPRLPTTITRLIVVKPLRMAGQPGDGASPHTVAQGAR
ncbi:MAG TPA: hypothetical protein VMF13_09945, partial [Luteitalea sp.]|nr:hypothetical protein [Luteitalea sp.]